MKLPIDGHREEILYSASQNQVTIVVGETGSGKTTAIPQYLYEAGYGQGGMVGVTEPRRIAAVSVAKFVAGKLNVRLGETVAYKIRFDDVTSPETALKFMTDGILLCEMHEDPQLRKYSVIMIDEAHERSSNIDFLLGLLKQLIAVRPDFRIIIASATIDAKKFADYFGGAPIVNVDGRLHNVEIVWHDKDLWSLPVMMRAAVETVSKILESTTDGDILVFLTGVDEINTMSDELEKLNGIYNLVVLPAHGGLSPEDQNRVFSDYPGKRKVVLATNIAETSITIEGVIYVVDCGLIKQTNFNTETGIGSLDVVEHSQAGCKQRSGRAGRTKPGVCYRLYTSQNYAARPTFTLPEIKRMSLAGVVLTMEALQLPNVRDFDFIDKPDKNAFKEAYATLEASGAIEVGKSGLTSMGKEMASLPLDPWISRFIIEAKKIGCVLEAVTIAAFISVGRSVFARPKDKEMEAEAAHSFFKDTSSDMLTYLNVWREYECSGFSRGWCFKNFLMDRKLMEVQNIRQQLLQQLRYRGVEITQAKSDDDILRCVAISFAYNLLHHTCRHAYEGVGRETDDFVFVHPSSSVFGASNPSWLVAFKLVSAKKLYAWMCSVVKVEWLPEIAPTKFTFGEQMIHSYNPQTGVVTVSREIISREKGKNEGMLGFQFRQVTLAEAYEIQEDYIKKVVKSDWKLLTIEAPAGWRANSYPERGQAANGRSYGLAFSSKSFSLNAGEKYFCRPSWHDPYVFHPEFRVYDFPLENRKPALVGKVVKIRPADFKADHNSGSLGFLLEEAMKRATPTAVSE